MKRNVLLLIAAAVISSGFQACKSKQKVVTIPNAHAEAVAPRPETQAPVTVPDPQPPATPITKPEEVRDEKFELDKEEKDTAVMTRKYHVVVGSFKNRDNAKGLQQTLTDEGHKPVVVVNEHGMYRVLIASYPAYKEARVQIAQLKNRFPDAWVLVQKEAE